MGRRQSNRPRALAAALFDLAWLLPRTVGAEERQPDPLPRSQREVMRLLGRRPGIGVNAIARELGLQASNVSATVRDLVDRGLVERLADPSDGRQVLLHLTPAAEAARAERERRWGLELSDLLDALDPVERDAVLAAAPALASLARLIGSGETTA